MTRILDKLNKLLAHAERATGEDPGLIILEENAIPVVKCRPMVNETYWERQSGRRWYWEDLPARIQNQINEVITELDVTQQCPEADGKERDEISLFLYEPSTATVSQDPNSPIRANKIVFKKAQSNDGSPNHFTFLYMEEPITSCEDVASSVPAGE